MMPDGFIVECVEKGTMRLSLEDPESGETYILPLLDTLLVPGIHSQLVSIPALNQSGIVAQFNASAAELFVNGNRIVINDPYHRRISDAGLPFVAHTGQETTPHTEAIPGNDASLRPAESPAAQAAVPTTVSLELVHERLGHRSVRTIIAGETAKVWKGIRIQPGTDDYCVNCKIGGIPKANRGRSPPSDATRPGQVLFTDVIPNPAQGALTSSTSFKNYLIIVCAYSRYFVFIGLNSTSASGIIEAFKVFATHHRPFLDYSLRRHLSEIHVDAGSYFLSDEFAQWGRDNEINIIAAAPDHQEMNGMAEQLWQTARVTAFRMMTHARLPLIFFHYALMYAWQICVVLPAKSTSRLDPNGELVPTTPHYLYFGGATPDIRRYRVFGCPVVAKVYTRRDSDAQILDQRSLVQRGVRGIFIGFPVNQAGWSIYIPASRHIIASADVSFDESFDSVSSLNNTLYHDSLMVRSIHPPITSDEPIAHTGPPLYVPNDTPDDAQWTPFTALPPELPVDIVNDADEAVVDIYEASGDHVVQSPETPAETLTSYTQGIDKEKMAMFAHYLRLKVLEANNPADEPFVTDASAIDTDTSMEGVEHNDASQVDYTDFSQDETMHDTLPVDTSDEHNIRSPPPLRRSERIRRAHATHIARQITGTHGPFANRDLFAIVNAISCTLGEPGTDPSPFHPEPKSVRQVLRLPPATKRAWGKSFYKEIKGLVVVKQCFAMEDPLPGEEVIPLMAIFRCKLDKLGLIDKLKARAVFRGDLHHGTDDMESWNPHATFVSLKIFLALCARQGTFPCQIDYIMAYVQAKMKGRVFAIIPDEWKELLPEELHKWCGRPLRLLKALYGYTFSGRLLYDDQAEFLRNYGLRETEVIALWKMKVQGGMLLVLQYVDDFLAAGPTRALEDFKVALAKRFDIETQPRADWYLQARIRSDSEGNILLDQQRFSKSIVRRYLPNSPEFATPDDIGKYRSPLPAGFKFTKDDNSATAEDVRALEDKYGFRYIEVAGSLNYLANTATEELFAIRKFCRHMNRPGRAHFKALLHLLHHLRCHPTQALVFYKDWRQSPVYQMLSSQGIQISDGTLTWFTDASHGDCDESRSTACYMGFFQGGLIDASSFVAQPIPHSTAESKTIALATGAMACTYARRGIASVLYDDPDRLWTVPMISDSQAAIAMNSQDKPTRRSRHIERRWFYARQERLASRLVFHHIDADHSLADLGTKNLTAEDAAYKLSIVERAVSDQAIGNANETSSCSTNIVRASQSKKGDGPTSSSVTQDHPG